MLKNPVSILLTAFVMLAACTGATNSNRLATASSPYLRQHADNPVHWNEWGEEALARAKKENKPLLISIGYASCHWCHVMEDETFMDTSVAAIMNADFICIKVDREERPDIDQIYQDACQLINGSGGWPLNAFALPDGKPFYAGTYFSNKSWKKLLGKVANAYKTEQKEMENQANALTKGISDLDQPFSSPEKENQPAFGSEQYKQLWQPFSGEIDFQSGGIKGAPKFPMPVIWEWMLQYHYLTGDKRALDAVSVALTNMALGGIYDQVGGGFARYATDSLWRVPHFEKMLYDNAQLMSLYAHAYQVTRNPLFKNVMEETADFIERELTSPDGAFYSSLNAVSDHEEGSFYAWSDRELRSVLNPADAGACAAYFHATAAGNWKVDKNILYATMTPEAFASGGKMQPEHFARQLKDARQSLLNARSKRVRPDTDSKILCGWNALMVNGLLDAYVATGREIHLSRALKCAAFLEKNMSEATGGLFRNYNPGNKPLPGFLDDYALYAKAGIRLYQVTFDKHWLDAALRATTYACEHFYDKTSGLFYYTPSGSRALAVRKMELSDGPIPSSNSLMCGVLHDLGLYFEKAEYVGMSAEMLAKIMGEAAETPRYYAQWCFNSGLLAFGVREVAIVGADAPAKNLDLQGHYLPNCLFMGTTKEENLPLLEGKYDETETLLYVCTNKTCQRPVDDTPKALQQIR